MKKVAVFGSGNGSNFQAIVEYFKNYNVEFTCISDKKDAYILERAKNLKIPCFHVPFKETADYLTKNKFDLIVLAGYMRILPKEVIDMGRFINIHPSLLPSFKGKEAIKDAYYSGVKVTGVTVHRVSEEVDAGPILSQIPVFIEAEMKFHELENVIHAVEHKLYPLVIENLLFDKHVEPHVLLFNPAPSTKGCGSGGCGC